MNVTTLNSATTQEAARAAMVEYSLHRGIHDEVDEEVERIYRAIAQGKVVISLSATISQAGTDGRGHPRLAVGRADCRGVTYRDCGDSLVFLPKPEAGARWSIRISRGLADLKPGWDVRAIAPRIPPQYRPHHPRRYWLLWEAEWQDLPRDPMLLRKIGRDAYVVLAAWDLTEVELSVLRAHGGEARNG
ncbi:MAG: hypothetical protein ABFD89_29460 [Bryobacteraceae bacterium]